jgi:flagellum-specific peptidoglycan hydrolase FlgJ
MLKKIIIAATVLILVGCNATRPIIITTKKPVTARYQKTKPKSTKEPTVLLESTSKTLVTNQVVENYVAQFKVVAMGNMRNYGIPASIILAQGILESGAGKGDLALNANNHFGIKCNKNWNGESVRHNDDSSQECFRKYNNSSESYQDHAVFLTSGSRYSSLFDLPKGDYKAWAKGLRAAGYATDPRYPEKLISYIEAYSLHQYDNQVLGNKKTNSDTVATVNVDTSNYEVQKGDTLYSLSKKFNITIDDLRAKNNISENGISLGQKLIVK